MTKIKSLLSLPQKTRPVVPDRFLPTEGGWRQGCEDVRDKLRLNHQDILALNFIRTPCPYVFRRHYRTGLRSHIMEVLDPADVESQREGLMVNEVKHYPKAKPKKMLRIFRTKFSGLKSAEEELQRVKTIARFLAPNHMATSSEFLVDYTRGRKKGCLLCGLQEYVEGETINPWTGLGSAQLFSFFHRMTVSNKNKAFDRSAKKWLRTVQQNAEAFVGKLRDMILKANTVPDLAGAGNLILTFTGRIKLVDINNISRVSFDATIPVDDRGYPVCDRSIEALSLLEEKLLQRPPKSEDVIYRVFLDPERIKAVRAVEKAFYRTDEPDPYRPD
ncbi:MAG: hypothetical protein P8175_00250 [Deltaproteobacteria bacterium]|jgi:hypothetical protein